jgi:hypothetical protein
VGRLDQNRSSGDWLGGCGLDSTGSGQGPVAGCCECGDEPSGSCATELVSTTSIIAMIMEAVRTSETSVYFEIIQPYIPEDCNRHISAVRT